LFIARMSAFSLYVAPRRLVMLGRSRYSRAVTANVGEIERRVRSLEQRVQRVGGRASAGAAQTADHVGESIASALSSMADRFSSGANSMGIDTAKLGGEAAKLGNDALRRLSKEVEQRPLVTLAVAVGVGILVGLVSHRR
jgi:ElaB/YqjD/DUF883 family membrane-anchored ribosome-binding protein